ncbi:MAG: PASTA domain-containing protein [Ruminococcaceae bacterium]|nr:PASTA domain-containing protein [Oscillospiraceae bacterium]
MLNTDRLCRGCMTDNGGESICDICGYDSAQNNPENCLPTDFWLQDRYLVGKVLDVNSEGVTYIGWDNGSDSVVHIREYFPGAVAVRNPDRTVFIPDENKFAYNGGLMDFLSLNRLLSKSELTALVPVTDVFEENGTAYAVFAAVSGISLQDFLDKNGGSLKWEQARSLFLPLIDTLAGLHEAGVHHYGISPETIIVGRDGKMRLGSLSISKIRDAAQDFEALLYPGYSALEQYKEKGLNLSEATDVYGLSSTLFRVLIGTVPPDAVSRLEKDNLSIPSHFAQELPRQVLVALANGMQVLPENRTASIEAFRNELVYGETAEAERVAVQKNNASLAEAHKNAPKKKKGSGALIALIAGLCTVLVIGVGAFLGIKLLGIGEEKEPVESVSSITSSIPDKNEVGEIDSDVAQTVTKYEVENYMGKLYSGIFDSEKFENSEFFKFTIVDYEFSAKEKGTIIKQSINPGQQVERDTEIQLTISLGPKEFKAPDVIGMTLEEAKIALLKQGVLYNNIKVEDMYDEDKTPNAVIEQEPKYPNTITIDDVVIIRVNTYTGEKEDTSSENYTEDN